jgi:hypothetical protein
VDHPVNAERVTTIAHFPNGMKAAPVFGAGRDQKRGLDVRGALLRSGQLQQEQAALSEWLHECHQNDDETFDFPAAVLPLAVPR